MQKYSNKLDRSQATVWCHNPWNHTNARFWLWGGCGLQTYLGSKPLFFDYTRSACFSWPLGTASCFLFSTGRGCNPKVISRIDSISQKMFVLFLVVCPSGCKGPAIKVVSVLNRFDWMMRKMFYAARRSFSPQTHIPSGFGQEVTDFFRDAFPFCQPSARFSLQRNFYLLSVLACLTLPRPLWHRDTSAEILHWIGTCLASSFAGPAGSHLCNEASDSLPSLFFGKGSRNSDPSPFANGVVVELTTSAVLNLLENGQVTLTIAILKHQAARSCHHPTGFWYSFGIGFQDWRPELMPAKDYNIAKEKFGRRRRRLQNEWWLKQHKLKETRLKVKTKTHWQSGSFRKMSQVIRLHVQ